MSDHPQAAVSSTTVFKPDIFQGKVAFVTGGGSGQPPTSSLKSSRRLTPGYSGISLSSGICYAQTEALMRHGCDAAIFGRRRQVIEESAAALSKATGRKCLGLAGDVRKPESLEEAVKQTLKAYGKIDFVIAGAAGNFLSSIERASPNAFKTVIEIDLVRATSVYCTDIMLSSLL